MVGFGYNFYLQLPGKSKQRILHLAKVIGMKESVYTAEVKELDLAVESGQDVLVYYEKNREFMQQSARIEAVEEVETVEAVEEIDETEPQLIISFITTGNPVSAESRQCYRVSTVMMDLTAGLGPELGCSILDVSITGFSVIATENYSVGEIVDASIEHDGQTYTGKICVQSVRELGKERIRYGLHCADEKKSPGNLAKGLQQMSISVQREQLRRRAGTT